MRKLRNISAILLCIWIASPVDARQWTDSAGAFQVDAELISIKGGKVYLEKRDGNIVGVPLERLSQKDLQYLVTLEEYRDYFKANPVPGLAKKTKVSASAAGPSLKSAVIHVDDDSKVGEVRRFGDLGWGVTSLAFSPDGRFLAVGKMDAAILVFDVDKSQRVAVLEKQRGLGQVTSLAFTPDGRKLLTGGYTGRIQVWNVDSNGALTEANRFVAHSRSVLTITVSRDGKRVLSGGEGKIARCWSVEDAQELFSVGGFSRGIKASFITRGGTQGLASDGESVALINMQDGKVIQTMKLAKRGLQTASIAPDGSRVVIGDSYNLCSWEIRSGKGDPIYKDSEIQWFATFLPNSQFILSGGRGKVNLWEVKTQQKIYEFDTAGSSYVKTIACSPDGRHIAAIPGSAGQELQVFRLPASVAQR